MGTAVMSGMIAASLIAIFIVPLSFYVVERISSGGEAHAGPRGRRLRRARGPTGAGGAHR
jgi:HAE1 family hydrophobic/amphiphilic exporter-1